MRYHYNSYGLAIESDIELPELPVDTASQLQPKIALRLGKVSIPAENRPEASWVSFADDYAVFWWASVGAFRVSPKGDLVEIDPVAGVTDDLIAFPLLGPVLSEILRRQGLFVLHASAVAIDGHGVALMADKGTGKSSTCMALLESGAQVLADDLVAVDTKVGEFRAGFGQLKLDPVQVALLDENIWTARPQVHAAIDKVRVMAPSLLTRKAVPARRLYVLSRGHTADGAIEEIQTGQHLPAALRFSYAVRFGDTLLRGPAAADHFRQATATVAQVEIKTLVLPEGLDRLDGLYDLIKQDLHSGDAS